MIWLFFLGISGLLLLIFAFSMTGKFGVIGNRLVDVCFFVSLPLIVLPPVLAHTREVVSIVDPIIKECISENTFEQCAAVCAVKFSTSYNEQDHFTYCMDKLREATK